MVQTMTTDIRERLIERMRAALDRQTRSLPDSIPLSVPLGPLVDAVIDEMSEGRGVPLIPRYDPEVWTKRHWTQPFTGEEALEGKAGRSMNVQLDPDDDEQVLFTGRRPGFGDIEVSLPAADAEQFLVAGLAVVQAARVAAQSRIDAP